MIYTKIHTIKATVHKAIACICNPEIYPVKINAVDKNPAYHMRQSFRPGEADFDTAQQIGMSLLPEKNSSPIP